ncbi:MAG: hypothetical protein WCX22_09410 [Methanoregula sp.]|jgi:hypothetical protein
MDGDIGSIILGIVVIIFVYTLVGLAVGAVTHGTYTFPFIPVL